MSWLIAGLLFVGITTINSEKVIVGELSDITTDAQIVIRDEKTVACSVDKPDVLEDPGILQSPSQQQDDMDCHWLIRAPNGYSVRLDFEWIDLETVSLCSRSSLSVYDSDVETDKDRIGYYCSLHVPGPLLHSSQPDLLIIYQAASAGDGTEFNATYVFVEVTESACGSQSQPKVLEDWEIGGFVTPNWPAPYPANSHCQWRIITSHTALRLSFSEFHLQKSGVSYCDSDNLTIYDGSEVTDHVITVLCGQQQPDPVGMTSNVMLVVFRSDHRLQYKGVQTRFRHINTTDIACGLSQPTEIDWAPGNIINPVSLPAQCTWRFTSSLGKIIRFDISKFDLPNCSSCGCASVSVHDGANDKAPLIGMFCGEGWGDEALLTGGHQAFVVYSAYNLMTHEGFVIKYSFYDTSEEACSDQRPVTLSHSEGVIASPLYGKDNYPYNSNCHWKIMASLGQVVRIEFQDFSLTNCAGCSCDNLTLYNGESTTAPRIQLMCGTYRPNSIQTTVSALYVTFMSSPITSSSGFYSKYSFHILSDTACGWMPPADMYYEPGDIVSPNYGDGLYPPFSHCEWHVRVPLDVEKVLEVNFESFNLEYGDQCEFDSLEVYDGPNIDSTLLNRICGNGIPKTLRSSGRDLYFVFRSNHVIERPGFHAHYIYVVEDKSNSRKALTVILAIVLLVCVGGFIFSYCKIGKKVRKMIRRYTAPPRSENTPEQETETITVPDVLPEALPEDVDLQWAARFGTAIGPPRYDNPNYFTSAELTGAPPSYEEAIREQTVTQSSTPSVNHANDPEPARHQQSIIAESMTPREDVHAGTSGTVNTAFCDSREVLAHTEHSTITECQQQSVDEHNYSLSVIPKTTITTEESVMELEHLSETQNRKSKAKKKKKRKKTRKVQQTNESTDEWSDVKIVATDRCSSRLRYSQSVGDIPWTVHESLDFTVHNDRLEDITSETSCGTHTETSNFRSVRRMCSSMGNLNNPKNSNPLELTRSSHESSV